MASVPISHLIIFIASIVVAAGVAGTLTTQVEQVSQAIDDQGLDVSQEIRTDIEVISDSSNSASIYDGGADELTLLVKNAGSRTLSDDPGQLDILINGTYHGTVSLTVLDEDSWQPGAVAEVTVSGVHLPSGDHRVKVIAPGDEEVFEFRV